MIIYRTTNNINGHIYVGQHTGNNEEYIGSGKLIRYAIKKYGKENFTRETLEECKDKKTLDDREIYWIAKLKPHYNIAEGGTGGYNQGAVDANKKKKGKTWEEIYTPEGLAVMKASSKKADIRPIQNYIKEHGTWNKGKTGYKMPPCSKETKRKISEAQMSFQRNKRNR